MQRCHWSRIAAPVTASAAAAMAFQATVTPCAVAYGSVRNLLVRGAYQARAMAAKLTGAAMRDQWHRYTRHLHRLSPLQRKRS